MATLATGTKKKRKIWRARVKLNWTEYFLGVYETKEEAEEVEQAFRERFHGC